MFTNAMHYMINPVISLIIIRGITSTSQYLIHC